MKITIKDVEALPPLPPAIGIDLQYRMMLCSLAEKTQKELGNLHHWQYSERNALERIMFNIYNAMKTE